MKQLTMTECLRDAIRKSGATHSALERATGVKRASIVRFVAGEQSLRLDKADALAAYFGLTVMRQTGDGKRR
jgi:plasmid maintenance system antidote protein VapI